MFEIWTEPVPLEVFKTAQVSKVIQSNRNLLQGRIWTGKDLLCSFLISNLYLTLFWKIKSDSLNKCF